MNRFPDEFSELLTAAGRALLDGRSDACGALGREKFYFGAGLLDARASAAIPALLERELGSVMVESERLLPYATTALRSNADVLPKVGRQLTSPPDAKVGDAVWDLAVRCGLATMLHSESLRQLVGRLCGHPVYGPNTIQVMCFRPGDYVGPHTDHHPDQPSVVNGYTDVHLTFCTPGVEQQLLVYEEARHFSKVVNVVGDGNLTAYRLPFWHYTTPLVGSAEARRWLLLGSFHHQP